jgi:hypothetical protein
VSAACAVAYLIRRRCQRPRDPTHPPLLQGVARPSVACFGLPKEASSPGKTADMFSSSFTLARRLRQNFRSAPCPTEQPLRGTEQQLRATERDLKRKCMDGAMVDLLRSVASRRSSRRCRICLRAAPRRPVRWRVALPRSLKSRRTSADGIWRVKLVASRICPLQGRHRLRTTELCCCELPTPARRAYSTRPPICQVSRHGSQVPVADIQVCATAFCLRWVQSANENGGPSCSRPWRKSNGRWTRREPFDSYAVVRRAPDSSSVYVGFKQRIQGKSHQSAAQRINTIFAGYLWCLKSVRHTHTRPRRRR